MVSYGNLVFLSGIGAHFEGDIKAHTKHVLDEMQKNLERVGSSMEKVLKVNVYLNDLKDYAGMNEMFLGRFGAEPGVRTTIAARAASPATRWWRSTASRSSEPQGTPLATARNRTQIRRTNSGRTRIGMPEMPSRYAAGPSPACGRRDERA